MKSFRTAGLILSLSIGAIAQTPKDPIKSTSAPDNAVEIINVKVEQVFKAEDDGYQFIAYQITYRGKRVIVEDPIGTTDLSVGDELRVVVCRNDMSKTNSGGKKLIAFIVLKKGA